MHRWQRPTVAPIPKRQALDDWRRRLDPRVLVRRAIAVGAIALLAQTGWQWRSETQSLGQRSDIIVVDRVVGAGQVVTADDVRTVSWPDRLAPTGALSSLPVDAVARVGLVPGEVLAQHRLFPDPQGLEADERIVTIPQPIARSPADVGQSVELFGLLPLGDGLTTPAVRLAQGRVISSTESALSIAVAAELVPRIIEHVSLGVVDIVIVP